MFPINFNFPYRKKDGSLITMEKALDGAGADLDLIDLDDVAISSPADGDGLIYDNTAHKWKNIPIISRIVALFNAWKKNGAYNLCPNTASTQSVGGVTITVNSNKTVTIGTGTTSSSIFFRTAANFTVDNTGAYKLVGSPTDIPASSRLYVFDESSGDTVIQDADGNGGIGTLTAGTLYGMAISIPASTVISQDITFKPMITTDLNATYADYVPHAKTNRELTDYIIEKTVTTSSISFTANTEKNGTYDLTSDIPTGYKPFGVVGYNIGGDASVRRLRVADYSGTWYLDYSVKTTTTVSYQLIVDILFVKK